MFTRFDITTLEPWRRALLALLCLVGTQLALAGHQFQHDDAALVSDDCAVCVQLEHFDVPVPDIESSLPVTVDEVFQQPAAASSIAAAVLLPYFSRAPPVT